MQSINIHYNKGRQARVLRLENNADGLNTLRNWIFSAGFARKSNKVARDNVCNLIIWLGQCYCSWDGFCDCVLNDIFNYDAQQLKDLLNLLMNPDCKIDDFNGLNII